MLPPPDDVFLCENNIIHGPEYNSGDIKWKSLGQAFFDSMQTYDNRTAQIDALTGKRESYKELFTRCIRTAISMQENGIGLGDVILICSYNNMDTCLPYMSAMFLGAVVAGLHPGLPRCDIENCLKQVKPKMIFVEIDAVDVIEDCVRLHNFPTQFVVFGDTGVHIPFARFVAVKKEEADFKLIDLPNIKKTASIYFTSGSTGTPKCVCVSQYALLHQFRFFTLPEDDFKVSMSFSTFYWITSAINLVYTILNGSVRVICKELNARTIWKYISDYRVSYMFLSPTGLQELYRAAVSAKKMDSSSLKVISYGGSPLPRTFIESVKGILPNVILSQAYGLTETAGAVLKFNLADSKQRKLQERKPESCGRPISGISYKVVDTDTRQTVGFWKLGELMVKSDFFMNGYANGDHSLSYDEDGWFKTGDIAYFDDEFCFYIVDRIKDLLKVKNFQIAPSSIECIVCSHPSVKCAAVVSTATDADGDIPVACVVLNKDCEKTKEEDIKAFVDQHADSLRKLRGGVKFYKSLPSTITGKISRRALRDLLKPTNNFISL